MVTVTPVVRTGVAIGSADTNRVDNHVTVLNAVTDTVVVATKLGGVNVSGDLGVHCYYSLLFPTGEFLTDVTITDLETFVSTFLRFFYLLGFPLALLAIAP